MCSFSRLFCVSALPLLVNCQSVHTWDDGREWGEPEFIGIQALDTKFVDIAMDASGDAVVVWTARHVSEGPEDIWSNRYSAEEGASWSTPEPIPIEGPNALFPRVAVDREGNATVVWNQSRGTRLDIWSNRYTRDGGWGDPEPIEEIDDTGDAQRPEVAMDAKGNAVAVWYQDDGTYSNILSNRYTPGIGWGDPEPIEKIEGDARSPQVAVDPDGNAFAVWQQLDRDRDSIDTRSNIWSNRYMPGVGWGTQLPLETDDTGDAIRPRVAVDADGNAIAVWQQSDAALRFDIWSNRYTPSDGWGGRELIEFEDAGDATKPRVAMDPDGNAVAVWSQFDGTSDDIWSNRYTSRGHWAGPERIETNDTGSAVSPRVVMDANGSAVALWTQPDGAQLSIWSNRYTGSLGWGAAEVIEFFDRSRVWQAEVAIDAGGNAIAVWAQRVGANDELWSSRLAERVLE